VIAGAEITRVDQEKNLAVYRAYSKVNLALGVGAKRPDNYHDIWTVMVPVRVYDLVSVSSSHWSPIPSSEESPRISVTCPGVHLPPEKNLVYKAASAFLEETRTSAAISISVEKAIPAGAGMGGGSSDAAAVLLALNSGVLRSRVLSPDRLVHLAARIGADVPFFLGCNSRPPLWEGALCTGIGEKVLPLAVPEMWMVIVVPQRGVDTREAYKRWDDISLGAAEFADPRMKVFLDSAASGDIAQVGKALYNDLEDAVTEMNDVISETKRRLLEYGSLGAAMTGSGSAVFGLVRSEVAAKKLADRVRLAAGGSDIKEIFVTRTGVDRDAC
jgi:4-diphosphocytidyl-2-C-methyl-D-erythritol kinase